MTDRELLEQALEYIPDGMKLYDDFRTDIRARLAEDDDEPVAWMNREGYLTHYRQGDAIIPLYQRPQPKARLTDEEIEEIHREFPSRIDLFARAIERKIWEKNL